MVELPAVDPLQQRGGVDVAQAVVHLPAVAGAGDDAVMAELGEVLADQVLRSADVPGEGIDRHGLASQAFEQLEPQRMRQGAQRFAGALEAAIGQATRGGDGTGHHTYQYIAMSPCVK